MINIFQPNVDNKSLENLAKVFQSNWLGRGEQANKFEKKLSEYLNIEKENIHTISCCTDGIFGVYDIFNMEKGSEVIIPTISFPAIASSAMQNGMRIKVIDINSDTGNISTESLVRSLSKDTKAVFVTDYGGVPVDINEIRNIVGPDVLIFEDAACALGSKLNNQSCGLESDFACWSFDAMKLVTCGEGGAVYFKDSRLNIKAKEYFYLGLPASEKSGIDRSTNEGNWWEYQLNLCGRRSIFTNINAAIGLPQLDKIDESISRKRSIRSFYEEAFNKANVDYIKQDNPKVEYSNYFFTIKCEDRDNIAKKLKERGVYSTFRYYPLHKIDIFKGSADECPNADVFSNQCLNIPIHQNLTDSEVIKIAESVVGLIRGKK